MHGIQDFKGWLGQVHVHGLRLTDEWSSVGGHVQHVFLLDFPDRLVQVFDPRGNVWNVLDGATMGNDLVANVRRPEVVLNQIPEHVLIDDGEFSRKDTPGIHIGGERLEALVVAQNVGGRRRGHGRDQE